MRYGSIHAWRSARSEHVSQRTRTVAASPAAARTEPTVYALWFFGSVLFSIPVLLGPPSRGHGYKNFKVYLRVFAMICQAFTTRRRVDMPRSPLRIRTAAGTANAQCQCRWPSSAELERRTGTAIADPAARSMNAATYVRVTVDVTQPLPCPR